MIFLLEPSALAFICAKLDLARMCLSFLRSVESSLAEDFLEILPKGWRRIYFLWNPGLDFRWPEKCAKFDGWRTHANVRSERVEEAESMKDVGKGGFDPVREAIACEAMMLSATRYSTV
jgi:hypothetical protein